MIKNEPVRMWLYGAGMVGILSFITYWITTGDVEPLVIALFTSLLAVGATEKARGTVVPIHKVPTPKDVEEVKELVVAVREELDKTSDTKRPGRLRRILSNLLITVVRRILKKKEDTNNP